MIDPTRDESSNTVAVNVASTIRDVTVYRSGANVVREASLPDAMAVRDGVAWLRFDDLPLGVVDSSLRCRLKGAGGARATELRCELRLPEAGSNTESSKSAERRALEIEIEQLRGRLAFVREEIGFKLTLGERGKPEEGRAPMKPPVLARVETLRVLGERAEKLDAQLHELGEELRKAEVKLEELTAREEMQSTDRDARIGELRKSVVVTLQGATAGTRGQIELEYFIPGARWTPSYALRLGASLRKGELTMRAMVCQRSGEDWNGVRLTLSTADHQKWAEIPELHSKRIGRKQPPKPKKGWRPPPTGAELLYRDYDASFGGPTSAPPMGSLAASVPTSVLEGDKTKEYAPVSMDSQDEMDDFAEFPDEALFEEEFDDVRTAVREEVVFAANEPEIDMPPPAPMMASLAAPSPPRQSSRRSRKRDADTLVGGMPSEAAYGGAPRRPSQAPPPPQVDLDLMQYTMLRMAGPASRSRGSLRLCSRIELYAEVFAEHGQTLDPIVHTQLEQAQYRTRDIAAMPTGHREPWSEEFDYAYRAESTIDLKADGQFHSLPVARDEASCSPLHVVVPRESTDVFRIVKIDNPMDAPLLAGPLDVYWDDAFLLTSSVSFTAPRGKVELGLGVDQAVKVVRNTHYREDTTGLMGGSLELSHKIVIEVANEGTHEVSLEVRERVPVPAKEEDDIKLDIKSVSPAWSAFEPEAKDAAEAEARGMYRWQLPIGAGERKELTATYEIKMPSKYELQGGNRREW